MGHINLHYIKTNVSDDPDFIRQLIDVFVNSLDSDVPALERSIEAAEHDRIRRDAHKVKSGFRSFGMDEMTEFLQELEDMGRDQAPIDEIQIKMSSFLKDLPTVKEELKNEEF